MNVIYLYLAGGEATVESIFIVMLSGFVVRVVVVSVVVGATFCLVVSTAVESVLPEDMVDSLVPQLTANIPMPIINKNFFIIFLLVY